MIRKIICSVFIVICCSEAFAGKNKASREEIEAFVGDNLQAAVNEVTRSHYLYPRFEVVGDFDISYAVLMNILNFALEPIFDRTNDGFFDNDHGPIILYTVRFKVRDEQGLCHRASLYVQERRYGPNSNMYSIAQNTVRSTQRIIELDNENISKLRFKPTYDLRPYRYLYNRTIIDRENINCPENSALINHSERFMLRDNFATEGVAPMTGGQEAQAQ